MPVVCAWCAEPSPTDPPPLSWGRSVEGERVVHTCESCTRTHLRAMEGRLDPVYW